LREARPESIINTAAKKLKQATDEQTKKNDERHQQHLVQAATEDMKKAWATKAKGPAPAVKLPKTCKGHVTCPENLHTEAIRGVCFQPVVAGVGYPGARYDEGRCNSAAGKDIYDQSAEGLGQALNAFFGPEAKASPQAAVAASSSSSASAPPWLATPSGSSPGAGPSASMASSPRGKN